MKKRAVVLGMAMVMSMAMVTGCGSSKEDYLNDMEAFTSLSELEVDTDDAEELMEIMTEAVDNLDISTDEGKTIKEDMQELVKMTNNLVSNQDDFANMDDEEVEEIQTEMEEVQERIKEGVELFLEAAEEAGVEEEDLEAFDSSDLGL